MNFFPLRLKPDATFLLSFSPHMERAIMTQYLKGLGFVDLLIPCVILTELGGDDATRWDILFRG